ncbi:MAG: ATPase, T2SS/T4P/T4SS family, partial [Pseudomonadota bacterium]
PEGEEDYHRHVFHHKLGEDPANDPKIFGEGLEKRAWTSVQLSEDGKKLLSQMVSAEQVKMFEQNKDLDFSYEAEGIGRYRVNAHMQSGALGFALRVIKTEVPPLSGLNLPEVISRLTYLPRGLVLVTGDTGSGKTTTLAAMIQAMNQRYRKHIITLEDPVEYRFESDKSVIEQRELGADMPTFA